MSGNNHSQYLSEPTGKAYGLVRIIDKNKSLSIYLANAPPDWDY
jgi:hypothetical protein